MADDFAELDEMANGYSPSTGNLPGPEVLPEGTYSVEILKAELIKTPKSGDFIFRMLCQVIEGGHAGLRFERPQFLKSPTQLDILGGDFCKLGIDADKWGQRGKPWSQELIEASNRIVHKRFVGQRKDGKAGPNGQPGFPNFNVVSVINSGVSYEPPALGSPIPDSEIPF